MAKRRKADLHNELVLDLIIALVKEIEPFGCPGWRVIALCHHGEERTVPPAFAKHIQSYLDHAVEIGCLFLRQERYRFRSYREVPD